MDEFVARGASAVLAAAEALPDASALSEELAYLDLADQRRYFLPDEDLAIRLRYTRYLGVRAALLATLDELGSAAGDGRVEWRERLPVFIAAFGAACVLMRATRFIIDLAKDRSVVWKKLDEADAAAGIPRKSFTIHYKAVSRTENLRRFMMASDFYFEHRDAIRAYDGQEVLGPVVRLLEGEEPLIERGRRAALKRLFGYRWFSFLRRHRSAWRQVMFGLFKISGSAIAELRQPGVKPSGAPKRIDTEMSGLLLSEARAGDVFVTRHDDAMSNLFLPGFWPHAALYLGDGYGLAALGIEPPFEDTGHWFLEAKKDGVRFRRAEETLAVDACVVLRSPLPPPELGAAIRRAMGHAGKPYDFLFDFRNAEVLACTEVIYRGFHGAGPLRFHLKEIGGRLCLPAEELLDQALASGFEVIAMAGIGEDKVLTKNAADRNFRASRAAL